MKTCKECGSQNNSRVKFCTTCGSILDDDDDELDDELDDIDGSDSQDKKYISVNDTEQKSVDNLDDFMDDTFRESDSIVSSGKKEKEKKKKKEKKPREKKERNPNLVFILVPSILGFITIVMLALWLFKVHSIFQLIFFISLGIFFLTSLILWFVYQYKHRTVLTEDYLDSQKDAYKLILAYIGSNYDKILAKGFSLPAFLFGPFYLLYRKLYLIGISILIALDGLIFYFCTLKWYVLGIVFYLVVVFVLGLFFNSLYLHTAKKKIERIKLDYVNFSDMLDVAKKTGGTSLVWLIIMFVVLGVAIFFEARFILTNTSCEKIRANQISSYMSQIIDKEVLTVPSNHKQLTVTLKNESKADFSLVEYTITTTYVDSKGDVKELTTCSNKTFLSPFEEKKEIVTCNDDTDKATSYEFRIDQIKSSEIKTCK